MLRAEITPRRLAAGLALALAVGVGAGWLWLIATANDQARAHAVREARVLGQQLAELVAATELDEAAVGPVVALFDELHPSAETVRVVDLENRTLVASTAPTDTGEQAAPRRLVFEEKALYDLGQELRAAVEANRRDEGPGEPEIAATPRAGGGLTVVAPVERADALGEAAVVGIAIVETEAEAARAGAARSGVAALLVALVELLVLFLAAATVARDRPLLLAAIAAVLLVAALVGYGRIAAGTLSAGARATEEALDRRLAAEAERFDALLAGL
ncbi:MAG TPA: hypothetical protein VF100_00585, partial [Thermoanaerobaculia bacterium]